VSRWIRAHAVVLAGLALIAGQLGWTAAVLARSYFRQDDFLILDRALREGFGWKFLMWMDAGHLMPAGLAILWALARISLYNWLLTSAVIMVLVAAASLAMLRMLVTVFARPAEPARAGILVPLAVYLFGPLSVGAVAWPSAAVRMLPLQLAMFMAVDAHVRYLRGRRLRQLIAAAVWLVIGMASADQGALVPVLLFALTVGYFERGRLRDAAARAVVRHWRAWAVYGVLFAAYCVIFFVQLASSGIQINGPGKATSLYQFTGTLFGTAAVPGSLGGPWQWLRSGYAQAAPPAAVEYLSWIVAAIVVAVSCVFRPIAWRAWAILLGWIVAADILPVAIRGFEGLEATVLGAQTGYLADATGVLALCLGLAFLPAGEGAAQAAAETGGEAPGPASTPDSAPASASAPGKMLRPVRVVAILAFCCFVAGTVVSLQDFESVTSAAAARSYIATAHLALADAPNGTLIVDGPTPATVMDPGFFGSQADTAQVIGLLARGKRYSGRLSWTSALSGVLASPMTFDTKGQLRPVAVAGVSSKPPPRPKPPPRRKGKTKAVSTATTRSCWNVEDSGAAAKIPLTGTLYRWPWTARLEYSGPAGLLSVSFDAIGSYSQQIAVPAGSHVVYIPVLGSGNAVFVTFAGPGPAAIGTPPQPLCVTHIAVGLVQPAQAGQAIPARPVPG
jgi:hypothetical protein